MKLNELSTFKILTNNNKGQIAIFVALVFQVLFLFFAMVINVGLLVHHKINLQNSVDLAAYYGAMKQAETMNAIAHTNYQIRQSWKLLSWRYRVIGTAGDFVEHPFKKNMTPPQIVNGQLDGPNPAGIQGFYDAPSFCISYVPFKPMPPGENACKDIANNSSINLFTVPAVIIDLPGVSQTVRNLSQLLLNSAVDRCKFTGPFNYDMLGRFLVSYNIDQAHRMALMALLSKSIAPASPDSDFYDIDGTSVVEGVRQTLVNNLTTANASNVDFKTFNSLGHDSCNRVGSANDLPAKWLVPIRVMPAFNYIDTNCSGGQVQMVPRTLDKNTKPRYTVDPPNINQPFIDNLSKYIGVMSDFNSIYNYSVGVEKNPWCVAYMGVSATTTPKIPFSPFGSVELKARAYYKPFGGRIGPWYYKNFPSGTASLQGSSGSANDKIDKNYPPRALGNMTIGNPMDPTRAANYSRFVGDTSGLKSRRVLGQFGAAIYKLDSGWSSMALDNTAGYAINFADGAPNFDHWKHIPFDDFAGRGKSLDLLAWNSDRDEPSRFRELELAAILPDPFDLAYYSIEPDFYHNYYTRIRDGFLAGPGSVFYSGDRDFLGDIGTHKGSTKDANWDTFSVKDQYAVVKKSIASGFLGGIGFDITNSLTYISQNWQDVLTSWAPISLGNYALDTSKLGKCEVMPLGADNGAEADVPTPGNCVVGGSTGYSVKMVSPQFLRRTDLELGGVGVRGAILNPPPDDKDF